MRMNSQGDLEHNTTEDKLKRTTTENARPTQKGNNLKSKTNSKGLTKYRARQTKTENNLKGKICSNLQKP